MKKFMYSAGAMALMMSAGLASPSFAAAAAADAQSGDTASVQEVIVTGTRQTGIKAADSAAPIELVGATALTRTGVTDLASALATSVPSLNISTTGGDAAAVQVQAALRGLGPNDTLVLVDGKRRHPTSNLAVDGGSPYSGSATTDLSFIPVDAIDHIEVLTDGAAAQYGTDAIGGVVNIILKKSASAGVLDATGGQYFDSQGATGAISFNKGFNLMDRGFINVTIENRYHDFSAQGIGDGRITTPNGTLLPGLTFPESNGGKATNFPVLNRVVGDPDYNLYNGLFNAGYDLGYGVEAYAFGSYGYRNASHFENYRTPNKVVGCAGTMAGGVLVPGALNSDSTACTSGTFVVPFLTGFDPREEFQENDYSITTGVRGTLYDWHWDLSTTYGDDTNKIYVVGSGNAQLFPVLQSLSTTPIKPQQDFYNGSFDATDWTTNFDVDRAFNTGFLASPLNVASGFEYRKETYSIGAGEPSSYFGAGAQSFDGYTPLDQGGHSRTNYAGYIDLAADVVTGLHVDLAGRFEHFSDFGDTEVGKATVRYDFNPMIAIRGTVSSGFRAPTLAEEFYSGTNVSPSSADVQLPPNSAAAAVAGFHPLHPEQSDNYSVGFVVHPLPGLQATVDFYDIELKDRILASGFIFGTNTLCEPMSATPGANGSACTQSNGQAGTHQIVTISQGVLNAIKARGVTLDSGLSYTGISVFTNAATTRTQGIEATVNYASDFGEYGHVDWTADLNYNTTRIIKLIPLPLQVQNMAFGQVSSQTANAASALTTATPQEKVILQAYWTLDKFSVNLRETVYGPTAQFTATATPFFEKIDTTGITDIDIGYKIFHNLKLDIGANNLFNQFPPRTPTINGSPVDGGHVFNAPYTFSPWGINGGYYYGRVTFNF
ncbi:MAG TPA: TonB-dependent receptor [Caulobacteraceae bacterium]|nr:TonB-dependent receptor [Caulobacteraceae bacterium]